MISIIIRYSKRFTALLLAAMFAVSAGLAQERAAVRAPAEAAPRSAKPAVGQDKMKEKEELKRLLAECRAKLAELKRRVEGDAALRSPEVWAKELTDAELRLLEIRRRVRPDTGTEQGGRRLSVADEEINSQLIEAFRQVEQIKLIWQKRRVK